LTKEGFEGCHEIGNEERLGPSSHRKQLANASQTTRNGVHEERREMVLVPRKKRRWRGFLDLSEKQGMRASYLTTLLVPKRTTKISHG
jgi:hypothetical protein